MNDDARAVVGALGLAPHPEGGFFRETFRAPLAVDAPQGTRAASTAIYFLLAAGSFSALHRVRSDEVWHHYDGDPVEIWTLHDDGRAPGRAPRARPGARRPTPGRGARGRLAGGGPGGRAVRALRLHRRARVRLRGLRAPVARAAHRAIPAGSRARRAPHARVRWLSRTRRTEGSRRRGSRASAARPSSSSSSG